MVEDNRVNIATNTVRVNRLEEDHEKLSDAVDKLNELMAAMQTQMRITWALLFLLITSVMGLAFAVLRGGVIT